MRVFKKLLAPLLLAALLLIMLPPSRAAECPEEPDYTCADQIFDRIYGRLQTRKAPADAQTRADAVERLLADAEGVVAGSVRRVENDLTWMTEGGVACRFSAYLYSLSSQSVSEPVPDAPAKKAAGARDVCLIAPYYGLDSSFEGRGGTYDTWGGILARFTGGSYERCERTDATIDRLADAVESCGVVLIDSHGEMDPDRTTSYICLQTKEGITEQDYAPDPVTGISHAYYSGRGSGSVNFYEVDGTAISNHMDRDASCGLFWGGNCYGTATDGLCGPLLARGLETFYGYTRDVTFGGDRCWINTFMEELTDGRTVAEAAAEMKRVWGAWDFSPEIVAYNDWSDRFINHTAEEARTSGDAFPLVVSKMDPYPADPNTVQTVRSDWRLPRVELTLHLEVPDGVKCPDVSAFMFYSGRLPEPEGRPRNLDHAYSFSGWSLESFPASQQIPGDLFRPGDSYSFGYDDPDPLSFGDESVTLYAVYAFTEDGKTWYTTQVPEGEYDPFDPSRLFSDISFGSWYYQSVRDSVAMGLIKGYNDGTFRPNASIRRSEVVTILYRAAGSPAFENEAGFPDVPAGCFYEAALNWASEHGIVLGYNDGNFHPDDPVTRAQLAALLRRYAGAEKGDPAALDGFPDRGDVPLWSEGDLAWAVENELIKGNRIGGRICLEPLGPATRAQFTTILQRFLTTTAKEETP